MAQPYLGEVRMFGGNFAPVGWQFCDGRMLPISEYAALFNLIGTTYGGDGMATFKLPDLRGRAPVHMGQGPGIDERVIGEMAGSEVITLTQAELPIHSHTPVASGTPGNSDSPDGMVWAKSGSTTQFAATPNAAMAGAAIGIMGGSQPHDNMPPFVAVNFIIALEGVYPSPS